MRFYPAGLDIRAKKVLVIGAGRVAERKIKTLLAFGADVLAVAPAATPFVARLARKKKIAYLRRKYKKVDLKGQRLVIVATSDKALNERAARDALKKNIWANVVDRTSACEFIAPAVIRRKGLVVAVSTDARNPPLSKAFRKFLEDRIDEFFSGRHRQ